MFCNLYIMLGAFMKFSSVLAALTLLTSVQIWAGESGGGGGNAIVEGPVDRPTIKKTLNDIRPSLKSLFKEIEVRLAMAESVQLFPTLELRSQALTLRGKLFPKTGLNIYADIGSGEIIDLREQGPCIDLDGKPMDASAFPLKDNKVCFSLERLEKKLGKLSYSMQLLALAGHEYTHRLGGTEEEARAVQTMIFERISNKTVSDFPQFSSETRGNLDRVKSAVASLKSMIKSKNEPIEICGLIAELSGASSNFQATYIASANHYGASLFGPDDFLQMFALPTEVNTAVQQFCMKEEDPGKSAIRNMMYENKFSVTLSEFMSHFNGGNNNPGGERRYLDMGNIPINYVRFSNIEDLNSELGIIEVLIKNLSNALTGISERLSFSVQNTGPIPQSDKTPSTMQELVSQSMSKGGSGSCQVTKPDGDRTQIMLPLGLLEWATLGIYSEGEHMGVGENATIQSNISDAQKVELLKSPNWSWELWPIQKDAQGKKNLTFVKRILSDDHKTIYEIEKKTFAVGQPISFTDTDKGIKIDCKINLK
jgi:hypothetical protein